MNFTREPIIETIITPRDGGRLVIRSSKHDSQEEFAVEAVEIVSFGQALFFRSLEKPRPFLVPVSDYEVVEVKESRVVLKSVPFERTIKIGGGREGSLRKESPEDAEEQVLPVALEEEVSEETGQPSDKRRDRRRHRRRRALEEKDDMKQRIEEPKKETKPDTPSAPMKESAPLNLIPPPPTLISKESIHRYKEQQSQTPEPPKKEAPPPEPPEPEGDSNPISRVALEPASFTAPFTSITDWNNF